MGQIEGAREGTEGTGEKKVQRMKSANDVTSNVIDALNKSPDKDVSGVTAEDGVS